MVCSIYNRGQLLGIEAFTERNSVNLVFVFSTTKFTVIFRRFFCTPKGKENTNREVVAMVITTAIGPDAVKSDHGGF